METLIYLDPILKLFEILAILGGAGLAILRMVQTSSEVKSTLLKQNDIIGELRKDMKDSMNTITNVLTQIAIYETRIERIEEDVRELRHGRGYILAQKEHVRGGS